MTTIAVAVVARHGDVLVGRRHAAALDAAGLAEFPGGIFRRLAVLDLAAGKLGGKVEDGETPEDAAARECLEEAGIAVRIGPLLDRAKGTAGAGPLDILFFAATPLDDREEPHLPFAWTPLARLPALRFPAANAGVLARLAQGGS